MTVLSNPPPTPFAPRYNPALAQPNRRGISVSPTDLVGWAATAAFAMSYFLPEARMRLVQMLGASLWLAYGILLGEPPIIVANSLVLVAAFFTTRRRKQRTPAAG